MLKSLEIIKYIYYLSFVLDAFLGGPGSLGGGGMGLGTPPITQPSMSTSQPLPSNVLSKQQSAMDQQYMQQSSQIFVFSTTWANKAAQAVMEGAYPTIICWHENQNETKKHLAVSLNSEIYVALLLSDFVTECCSKVS